MHKWLHRGKVAFIAVPIIAFMLVLDLISALWDGLDEFWTDVRDASACLRDEWTTGAEEAQSRSRVRGGGAHG